MAIFSKITLAALAAALPSALTAAHSKSSFAVLHFYGDGPLLEARMDPVVDPGAISGHVHTIQGGNAFNFNMSNDFASSATCTTSRINKDLSNYWAPKLYFQSPKNGSFIDVPLYYMNVYYFFDKTSDEIVPFEPGFRMTSGNPTLRTPPKTADLQLDPSKGTVQPIEWTCPQKTDKPAWPAGSNGIKIGMQSKANEGAGVGFPNKDCNGEYSPLRSDIHFPSCYNPNAGLTNYKNNTAFPSDDGNGNLNCPDGYDHVPHLFYELYWNTPLFADEWTTGGDSQPFVLANGDPTGYSLHADFISGWDKDALKWTIDNCDAGDAGMDTCTGIPGGTVTGSAKQPPSCNLQSPIDEVITGSLSQLPGCNPIVSTGTATPVASCSVSPSADLNGAPIPLGSGVPATKTGSDVTPTTMATSKGAKSSATSTTKASKTHSTKTSATPDSYGRRRSQHLHKHREASH